MYQPRLPANPSLQTFLANFGIAISQVAPAIHTGSGSLMAKAIHAFADKGN
jgi:divalent metal cation (Fe/Co/Zn/Cd) transporter